MTKQAIDALRAEREHALALAGSLSAAEWALQSDCAGWRVQDVFAHMAATFHAVADPSAGELDAEAAAALGDPGDDAERRAEIPVATRKTWTPEQVMAEYTEWSTTCIDVLAAMQEPPLAETVIPLGNLGAHPMHILANALVFDHYCHLRHDLLAPNGPLQRAPLPSDDLRLVPTMDWMMSGVPQMCASALGFVDRPVAFAFDGPGAGTWTLRPPAAGESLTSMASGVDANAACTIHASAHDYVCWGTKRRDWRSSNVRIDGDRAYAERVLDAINVI